MAGTTNEWDVEGLCHTLVDGRVIAHETQDICAGLTIKFQDPGQMLKVVLCTHPLNAVGEQGLH